MAHERPDHVGHPTSGEIYRARFTGQRLGALLAQLTEQGFDHNEGLAFIAGVVFEVARERGETWYNLQNTKETLERLLAGRAAKTWSLDALDLAITAINDLASDA